MGGLQKEGFGSVNGQILQQGLHDMKVLQVYRRIRYQHFDSTILEKYYGFCDQPKLFNLPGIGMLEGRQIVDMMVNFLAERASEDPVQTTIAYRERFRFKNDPVFYRPIEFAQLESEYNRQKLYHKTSVLMLSDILHSVKDEPLVIADIGAGVIGMGRVLLEYTDREQLRIKHVICTDIIDQNQIWNDSRFIFRKQSDEVTLPIEKSSVDLAILKWSFHHMTRSIQERILEQIRDVLKPGGKVVLIEAMIGDNPLLLQDLRREISNSETWPTGPWYDERVSITEEYLKLNTTQQKQVLALEDWLHWLESPRIWQPLPFTYMKPEEVNSLLRAKGLEKSLTERRVFGYAPIIRYGPPTIRFVFQKPSIS